MAGAQIVERDLEPLFQVVANLPLESIVVLAGRPLGDFHDEVSLIEPQVRELGLHVSIGQARVADRTRADVDEERT